MMPLVAILPEKSNGNAPTSNNMVETTEKLARKLLSEPSVLRRVEELQNIVLAESARGDNDSANLADDRSDQTD